MLEDEGIVDSNLATNLLIHGVDEGLIDRHALLHSERETNGIKKNTKDDKKYLLTEK